jgi:hypothetical protein
MLRRGLVRGAPDEKHYSAPAQRAVGECWRMGIQETGLISFQRALQVGTGSSRNRDPNFVPFSPSRGARDHSSEPGGDGRSVIEGSGKEVGSLHQELRPPHPLPLQSPGHQSNLHFHSPLWGRGELLIPSWFRRRSGDGRIRVRISVPSASRWVNKRRGLIVDSVPTGASEAE